MPLPFRFQEGHIAHLIEALRFNRFVLDGSDTGTGKTYAALFVAQALNLTPSIICPKSVIPSWSKACREFGLAPKFVVNYERVTNPKASGSPFSRKSSLVWEFGLSSQDLLIFDEAHRMRNYKTAACKLLVSATSRTNSFKCLLLSATLAESPLQFKGFGEALGLFQRGQFWPWAICHGVYRGRWGFEFVSDPTLKTHYLTLIRKEIFPKRGSAIHVSDVAEFPKNNIFIKPIPTTELDRKKVEEEIQEVEAKKLTDAPFAIVDLLRVRQTLELLKVSSLVELAQDAVDTGHSVVIFAEFKSTIEAIAKALGVPATLTGDTNDEERARLVSDFQSNLSPILICQIGTGGVGLSLHDLNGRPRIALICPTYSATQFKQALGRICRAGSLSPAVQYLVYAEGTVEERMMKVVEQKLKNLQDLVDSDLTLCCTTDRK